MFTFITPATPRGQLRMRVASFYELLKISLALHTRPLHTLLELRTQKSEIVYLTLKLQKQTK